MDAPDTQNVNGLHGESLDREKTLLTLIVFADKYLLKNCLNS